MVQAAVYTDPLCPWSWASEPVLRRLQVEFAGQLEITWVMAGMAAETDPDHLLGSTLDAVAASGMPADPRVWREGAPRSSHPACMAVKAAAEQGLDGPYLRRLREGLLCRRERIDNAEAFLAAARDVDGLDAARFEIDLRSHAIVEAFGADRERAAGVCGADRPSLPTFTLAGEERPLGDPSGWRTAIVAAGAAPGPLPGVEEALRQLGPMAAAEVAAVCDLAGPRAQIELWRLAEQFRARPEPFVCGELWTLA